MSQDPFQDDDFAVSDAKFDVGDDPTIGVTSAPDLEVHIRSQQRNGRKSLTLVQGLPPKLNLKMVLQYFKRQFCCNGTIVEDKSAGRVLQLQGDQRARVAEFLVQEGICRKDQIKVHGVT